MKAIPTVYCGVAFRSRLEASYAAHFDARGMPWTYEPEGYELEDGSRYLPDFWLPSARAWVEVKGWHNERLEKVYTFANELWAASGADNACTDPRAPMVLLLRPPDPERERSIRSPWPMNVMPTVPGGEYRYGSATWARCKSCHASTVIALWQRFCRNCGKTFECGYDAWYDPVWMYEFEFKMLPGWKPPADPQLVRRSQRGRNSPFRQVDGMF